MSSTDRPLYLATRGSPLALAQAHIVQRLCREAMPHRACELRIIKTTGDKLQKASMANPSAALPKGLFTKELEIALLNGEADLAVHSLKDLPTEVPAGLELGAVLPRADVRDILVYRGSGSGPGRGFAPDAQLTDLPADAVIATSSTRRQQQLLVVQPGFRMVEIRGNVGTRLHKVATLPEIDATILAAAGLARLGFRVEADGRLSGPTPEAVPPGLLAIHLDPDIMIPAVGQAAIGIETRRGDPSTAPLTTALNDGSTMQAVTAERAFLRAMGGGCQSPVAAHAVIHDGWLRLRAVSFHHDPARRDEISGASADAEALGTALAHRLR